MFKLYTLFVYKNQINYHKNNFSFNKKKDNLMKKEMKIKIADILQYIARYFLLIVTITIFIFSLLSGEEQYGGGISGIIKNSPNAIPWAVLFLLVLVAWKFELIGGIIITIGGLFFVYFFNFRGENFFLFTFILTMLITLMGIFFILSYYLRKEK